jgi:cytochrome c peroxidase
MVNSTIPREGNLLLHFDGEFASAADLARATLTGRNFGWLPTERAQGVRHIARVIREDEGSGPLAREFGGFSYREVLLGTNSDLGEPGKRFHIPAAFRIDVLRASDEEILDAVANLLAAYMESLQFSRDESWEYDGSPYDAFLETNRFPRRVDPGATERYYNRHLADLFLSVPDPTFVSGSNGVAPPAPGRFKVFHQEFRFGALELAGARLFFSTPQNHRKGSIGNCVACHRAPNFTDFQFHNTGAAQLEYDGIHGAGAFVKIKVPGLVQRNANFDAWLPATAQHPRARGPFCEIPFLDRPGFTDLGLWNVFANPDHPRPQDALREMMTGENSRASDAELLPQTVALFKTPSLRGLGFSHPYLHNGSKETLEEVIAFYVKASVLARAGKLRNAGPELLGMRLDEEDVEPLAAFLRSLNEDYE